MTDLPESSNKAYKLTLKVFSTFRRNPFFPTLFLRIFMQEPQYSHKQRTGKYFIFHMQISDVIKPDLLSSTSVEWTRNR